MIKWLLEKIVGVPLNLENFNPQRDRIISSVAVIFISYLILGPLFPLIDNLIKSSDQPWYVAILTKYSFVAVTIKIVFLSLFTDLNNPIGRFKGALYLQLVGFIGSVMIHSILSGFIIPSPNISPINKSIYGLVPFAVNIVIFAAVNRVYKMRYFDERQFFQTDSNI